MQPTQLRHVRMEDALDIINVFKRLPESAKDYIAGFGAGVLHTSRSSNPPDKTKDTEQPNTQSA